MYLICMSIKMDYDALCLSGGKLKGFAHLGAITQFYPHIKNVKYLIGTSIGAPICLLLMIGCHPLDIYLKIKDVDLSSVINPLHILRTLGVCEKNLISNIIKPIILSQLNINHIPTLKELYNMTGKLLVMTTYDIDNHKLLYMSHLTYPNLNCLDAVEMSINIPPLFGEVKINGSRVIDAGLINNCPYEYFNNGKKVLAINLVSKKTNSNNIISYGLDILDSTSFYIEKIEKNPKDMNISNVTIINVTVKDPGLINISNEKKMNLYTEGLLQSYEQYKKLKFIPQPQTKISREYTQCLSNKLDAALESAEMKFLFYMFENHPELAKKRILTRGDSTVFVNNIVEIFKNNQNVQLKMSMDFLKKNNSLWSKFKEKWEF